MPHTITQPFSAGLQAPNFVVLYTWDLDFYVGGVLNAALVNQLKALFNQPAVVPVYHYWNNSDHYYSQDNIPAGFLGYTFQQQLGYFASSLSANTKAIHRYFNGADHYYTIDYIPQGFLGYSYEGILAYVLITPPSGDTNWTQLHQYFNASTGHHIYTTDYDPDGFSGFAYQKALGYIKKP